MDSINSRVEYIPGHMTRRTWPGAAMEVAFKCNAILKVGSATVCLLLHTLHMQIPWNEAKDLHDL